MRLLVRRMPLTTARTLPWPDVTQDQYPVSLAELVGPQDYASVTVERHGCNYLLTPVRPATLQ